MRSKQLRLEQYDTDKIAHRYLDRYDPVLQHMVEEEVKMLELGIHKGGSLLLWRDYFPKGRIVGVDLRVPDHLTVPDRVQVFQGSQSDTRFLSEVAGKTAPDGFDIIIDDASHVGDLTRISFWHLFDNHLKPGGLYVIEDWGTGYWEDWPDGALYRPPSRQQRSWLNFAMWRKHLAASHCYGMVGFIKELVDEQGAADMTRGRSTGSASRQSKFESMTIVPSIVFIKKRSQRVQV